LEFASPFSFSLGDQRIELMPRPELVFIGLHRKWQEWIGQTTPGQLSADWLREHVLVSQWELRSRAWRYGKQTQIGSEGRVTYRIFDADYDVQYTLSYLADFAFYAGVGRKTTQGMGQVRRVADGKSLSAIRLSPFAIHDKRYAICHQPFAVSEV
jgi:CRISPR-associated endoribonuclease Cas6